MCSLFFCPISVSYLKWYPGLCLAILRLQIIVLSWTIKCCPKGHLLRTEIWKCLEVLGEGESAQGHARAEVNVILTLRSLPNAGPCGWNYSLVCPGWVTVFHLVPWELDTWGEGREGGSLKRPTPSLALLLGSSTISDCHQGSSACSHCQPLLCKRAYSKNPSFPHFDGKPHSLRWWFQPSSLGFWNAGESWKQNPAKPKEKRKKKSEALGFSRCPQFESRNRMCASHRENFCLGLHLWDPYWRPAVPLLSEKPRDSMVSVSWGVGDRAEHLRVSLVPCRWVWPRAIVV